MIEVDVIGGSGFIGTSLCQRLSQAEGIAFSIIDRAPSRAFPERMKYADVRALDSLRECIADNAQIVNLAAEHRDDVQPRSLYHEVNVLGARNICAIAREKHVETIVFTSTVAVYGFAPVGTDESGTIAPFNDYGHTKYEAEQIFNAWQHEAPNARTLVIIRPTVVFGEHNRGNVYNLLREIANGRFVMVGPGNNRKSMAYVENVSAFIEYATKLKPGVHIFNYVDKPDFTMNELVSVVRSTLGITKGTGVRLPFWLGHLIGKCFDLTAAIARKRFAVSSIRVKKFCADTVFETAVQATGFVAPTSLHDGLQKTLQYEFLESHGSEAVFYTE